MMLILVFGIEFSPHNTEFKLINTEKISNFGVVNGIKLMDLFVVNWNQW